MSINTAIQITTDQTILPVSIDEAKLHLPGLVDRSDKSSDDEDGYVETLIKAAAGEVEQYTNRKLTTCTVKFLLTEFPPDGITLPFSPVQSITSVKYYTGTVLTTWASTNYWYSIYEDPCVIRYDSAPGVDDDVFAVEVIFVCGYTATSLIPAQLRESISLLVGDMYEHRADAPREKFTLWQRMVYPLRVWHDVTENSD